MAYISPMSLHKTTVLIVDDDDMITDVVTLMLSKLGYASRVCHDATKGLADAVKYPPHAILLDLNMPGLDGFGFMKFKHELPEISQIPVIVLSANHTSHDVSRAMSLGAVGYITKPVDEEKLALRLGKVVPSPLFAQHETTAVQWGRTERKTLI